ncbi:MAG: ABC transporter permease [Lachnospiraceae bacterium]|nr:ABC transporter permease [Lachnospiraceae bacterium]MBO5145607.1 ABC transporter permease [Lachnospiraceae bacterium]
MASLICIIIGLLVGLVILYCINSENALDGFSRILKGGFYLKPKGIGTVLAQTAPLIMTGLSVAFAFKTGLFNIGAAGQYTLGALGALYFALVLKMPWFVCLLAAMLFGALWGAIPGIFKAYFNVNEVITAIMFNWIGLYAVNEIIYKGVIGDMYDMKTTKTYTLRSTSPSSMIPDMGLNNLFKTKSTTIAIFIAIIIAIVVYIVINKTTFGYELKACGHNKEAARYAGINDKKNIVLSMTIAGALSGIGAGLYYLSGVAEWNPQVSTALPAMGFNGIPVALLALSNPIGVIFAALFVSHITVGGGYLPTKYFQPEIADVIIAVIIYLCAFVMLFKGMVLEAIANKKKKKDAQTQTSDMGKGAAE